MSAHLSAKQREAIRKELLRSKAIGNPRISAQTVADAFVSKRGDFKAEELSWQPDSATASVLRDAHAYAKQVVEQYRANLAMDLIPDF